MGLRVAVPPVAQRAAAAPAVLLALEPADLAAAVLADLQVRAHQAVSLALVVPLARVVPAGPVVLLVPALLPEAVHLAQPQAERRAVVEHRVLLLAVATTGP